MSNRYGRLKHPGLWTDGPGAFLYPAVHSQPRFAILRLHAFMSLID